MQCFGLFHQHKSDTFPKLRTLKKMSIEAQYESFEEDNGWGKLFSVSCVEFVSSGIPQFKFLLSEQSLRTKSEKQTFELSSSEAKKADSKPRNRFRDVFPCKFSLKKIRI